MAPCVDGALFYFFASGASALAIYGSMVPLLSVSNASFQAVSNTIFGGIILWIAAVAVTGDIRYHIWRSSFAAKDHSNHFPFWYYLVDPKLPDFLRHWKWIARVFRVFMKPTKSLPLGYRYYEDLLPEEPSTFQKATQGFAGHVRSVGVQIVRSSTAFLKDRRWNMLTAKMEEGRAWIMRRRRDGEETPEAIAL